MTGASLAWGEHMATANPLPDVVPDQDTETRTKRQPPYAVILHNDDHNGMAFVVTVLPGQFATQITALLKAQEVAPGWGVHPFDIPLVQGNMLDVLDAEIATWQAQH